MRKPAHPILLISLLFSLFLAAATANAADVPAPSPAPVAAAEPVPVEEAPLVVFNRTVFVFRAPFLGNAPDRRAARAKATLDEILRSDSSHTVTIRKNPEGRLIMIDDALAFVIVNGDVDLIRRETLDATAERVAANLKQVIAETHEARSFDSLVKAGAVSAIATAVFVALLLALAWARRRILNVLVGVAARQADTLKVADTHILDRGHFIRLIQRVVQLTRWLIIALLTYEWLSFVLSRFPYTRPWGEQLNGYLLQVAHGIAHGIIGALPGLGVAVAIFLVARFFVTFLGSFLERVSQSGTALTWLAPDTLPTTRRLFNIAIWLFATAMAYPYLPGAQTEAFKGISVLVGLMVSLGASSIVGQAAAGLILTYTRTLRQGEYVRVGDHEGTVTRLGAFTTTIRTGLGEELTLPNSMITGTVTKNYSRTVHGLGFIVDTTVTIGYDTPWRQVEAMLIEAARRTSGILASPAPRVFQTALSDFYPEYRLVAQAVPKEPRPRAEIMTMLHANIQDVFNEHGVQIMSPHYRSDPQDAKVVKPEDWYRVPAHPPKS
jgi:small-conductance mechanosensitive channel